MEEVPRPLPFGTFITSECISNPPPRRVRISSRLPPSDGIIPHARRQAFCSAKGSYGSPVFWSSSIESNSPCTSMSRLSNTIFFSGIFISVTSTGNSPFRLMAALSTVPPISQQIGGVSLHPPPQFTRRGRLTVCFSVTILQLSLYCKF